MPKYDLPELDFDPEEVAALLFLHEKLSAHGTMFRFMQEQVIERLRTIQIACEKKRADILAGPPREPTPEPQVDYDVNDPDLPDPPGYVPPGQQPVPPPEPGVPTQPSPNRDNPSPEPPDRPLVPPGMPNEPKHPLDAGMAQEDYFPPNDPRRVPQLDPTTYKPFSPQPAVDPKPIERRV